MKLYCFLLLIIFICLVYDNKLYEGVTGQYDTSGDATQSYKSDVKGEETLLEQLGISELVPKDIKDQVNVPSNVSGLNCKEFEKKTCDEGIRPNDNHFKFGSTHGNSDIKKKCMRCLKCKDNYAFVDEFYARVCDTIAGCYDKPSNYDSDTMPYAYAHDHVDWNRACQESPSNKLNPLQTTTCTLLKDNTALDTAKWYPPLKAKTSKCLAKITALQTPGVGAVVSIIS